MNIMRKRISLVLSIMMLALTVLPVFTVSAATYSATVKNGSTVVPMGTTVVVKPGSKITVLGNGGAKDIYYAWDEEDVRVLSGYNSYDLPVPSDFKDNSAHLLYVSAGTTDDIFKGDNNFYQVIISSNKTSFVTMSATLNGKSIAGESTTDVVGKETFKAVASTAIVNSSVKFIGYYFVKDGKKIGNTVDVNGNTLTVEVPEGKAGDEIKLFVEAVDARDDSTANTVTKTGWVKYTFKYVEKAITGKDVNVVYNGTTLANKSITKANPGEKLKVAAVPADKVAKVNYKWDSDPWQSGGALKADFTIQIPASFAPGSTHKLYVQAEYSDGTKGTQKEYTFTIPTTAADITMNVKLNKKTISAGSTNNVVGGEQVVISASVKGSTVDYIKYRFDSNADTKVNATSINFNVPSKAVGTTLKLYVEAVAKDGSTTGEKVYNLKFVENKEGELDIEPWMEENDELNILAINLRNDSEETKKANKNIYALDEVVTYYIDYKNGTDKDIDSEVSIKLELPLDDMEYTVVDADGGTVDSDKDIITWVFPNGLKDGEAGTLIVKIKFTSFPKSKMDSRVIYPIASILQGKNVKDDSAVINLIIKDYDTEIKEEHEPYMYGDANADTFRPNDGISRAEGALVLARIYGLDYLNTKVTNNLFSDLDETYLEAQKAIIAATRAGLVNGYSDGTFRPNEKMTRAQFMSILGRMVEMNADAEGIDGLEVKDLDELVKVYADSTRYYIVDGKRVYSHWALPEITLLARLNMTPLSEGNDELELDGNISRAEVAQLVNFYLLRAPATVNSRTDSGFSDVTRRHSLFADIIEATRDAHTFSMDSEDGTERAR